MSKLEQAEAEHVRTEGERAGLSALELQLHDVLWEVQCALGMGQGLPPDDEILERLHRAMQHIADIIPLLDDRMPG